MIDTITSSLSISKGEIVDKVHELSTDTNVKRIVIKDRYGDLACVIPLGLGLVGAFLNPALAGLGAWVLSANSYTIEITRKEDI